MLKTSMLLIPTTMLLLIYPYPLIMVMTTISISTIAALTMKMHTQSAWLPSITLITYTGGMMIIFLYIASLSPNETNKPKINPMFLLVSPMLMSTNMMEEASTKKISHMAESQAPIIIAVILLAALISMTKITQKTKFPLQTKT